MANACPNCGLVLITPQERPVGSTVRCARCGASIPACSPEATLPGSDRLSDNPTSPLTQSHPHSESASAGDSAAMADQGDHHAADAVDPAVTVSYVPPASPADSPGSAPHSAAPQIPNYDVLGTLGKGGMGRVLKARHQVLDRLVAIKMPLRGHAAGYKRFLREAHSAAGLRHRNLCPIYEIGELEGRPFLVMAYIEGQTLDKWVRRERPMARQAAEIVAKLARAVDYAHTHGVVHRDLKPGNVMIETETGEPILMDFGLAKEESIRESQLTHEGQVLGTPAYMAPEQAAGQQDAIGPKTDVYGLGGILYTLLSGKPPFVGTAAEVLWRVRTEEPPSLRKVVPNLHRDLETICLKAMAKAPAQRYASARELADDLDRFCKGESILARRQNVLMRMGRRIARRPVLSALISTAVLAIVVGGGLLLHASRQRQETDLMVAFEAALDAGDWSPAALATMENNLLDLEHRAPLQATAARERMLKRFAASIEADMAQPRLTPELIARIESAVDDMARRDVPQAMALRASYDRRRKAWETLFDLSPPFAKVDQIFEPAAITCDGPLLTRAAPKPGESSVLYTKIPSSGAVSLDVIFDASWKNATELGLLIDAEPGHRGMPTTLAVSSDGKTVASGDSMGVVKLWDFALGREKATLVGHTRPVHGLSFLPAGDRLVSAAAEVCLWNLATGQKLPCSPAVPSRVTAINLAADGKLLAIGDERGSVHLFNPRTGGRTGTWEAHRGAISAIVCSPNGELLATAGADGTIILWDATTRQQRAVLERKVGKCWVLAFSPDGRILSGGASGIPGARFWDASHGALQHEVRRANPITSLAFAPVGKLVALAFGPGISLWDLASRQWHALLETHYSHIRQLAFAVDGETVFSLHVDYSIAQTHLQTRQVGAVVPLGDRGYRFLLHPLATEEGDDVERAIGQPVASGQHAIERRWVIEIVRSTSVLRRVEVDISRLPSGPLRLEASRQRDHLRFVVGELDPLEFSDPSARGQGHSATFAIEWPANVGLARTYALRQSQPQRPSPLEQGDSWFAQGRFSEALRAYQEQSRVLGAAETGQEARYQQALCLLSLKRSGDAHTIWQGLAAESGTRWPALAACQLWLSAMREMRFDEADTLFQSVASRYRMQHLASLLPAEMCAHIVETSAAFSARSELFKPSRQIVSRCERAAAMADFLQLNANLCSSVARYFVRALMAVGDDDRAREVGAEAVRRFEPPVGGVNWYYLCMDYCWLLRLAGQPQVALGNLEKWLAKSQSLSSKYRHSLTLELGRTLVHLQRAREAENVLDDLLARVAPEQMTFATHTRVCAILGFLREDRGDLPGAQEAWRQGLHPAWTGERGLYLLENLILGSLTKEVTPADARAFLGFLASRTSADENLGLAQSELAGQVLSADFLTAVLCNMFRTPRGRQYARKIVLREITFRECARVPGCLVLYEVLRQGAMPETISPAQDALVWQLAQDAFDAALGTGAVDKSQVVQLAFTWKGISNFLGWDGVAPRLAPKLRGSLAYVFGHRYLKLKRPADAIKFFQTARTDAPPGSELMSLAESELAQLGKMPKQTRRATP